MRTPVATIDLDALRHNYGRAREAAPGARHLAVVKSDAYGHGLTQVVTALHDADGFAVSTCGEAQVLREAGVARPILVLEGFHEATEIAAVERLALECVVHHSWQIDALERARVRSVGRLWLKVDTGMGRFGVNPAQAPDCYRRLVDCGLSPRPVGLMTHMAAADDPHDDYTLRQLRALDAVRAELPQAPLSIANSAGLLGWPQTHAHWNRPGIMLYGASPFVEGSGAALGLRPVMRLATRLVSVSTRAPGECIGYGHEWRCSRETRVGIAAIGYGDGYPRHAPSGTPVLVDGQCAGLLGRVSMDCIAVDLSALPQAGVGAEVVLWGGGLAVEEVAGRAATIAYELLCAAARVQRRYVGETRTRARLSLQGSR